MKINKKNTFNFFKLFIFLMYNVAYVLYMAGYINRTINLAILSIFLLMCIYQYFFNRRSGVKKKVTFGKEFKAAMAVVVAFFIISGIIQLVHGNVQTYLLSELLYNIIPPVLAFFWINTTDYEELKPYFYIFFIRSLFNFILRKGSNFTLQNIMSISWSNSKSSVFETPLAHDFIFLEIIFLYFKKTKIATISTLLCLLSFKRISFILAVLILIGYHALRRSNVAKNYIQRGVCKKTMVITFVIMCIMPLILNWMVSSSGLSYFRKKGIDLNEFTTGRVGIIQFVNKNIPYYNGYGSSDHFLTTSGITTYVKLGSMHCDLLKLYYEVTIVGVIIFTYCMIYIAKRKKIIFFMLIYLFMELISSHFLDVLSVWNMFFMFAAYVYLREEMELGSNMIKQEFEVKK